MSERVDNVAKAHEMALAANKAYDDNVARDKAITTLATLREHGLAEEWIIEPMYCYVARQLLQKAIEGKDFDGYICYDEPYGYSRLGGPVAPEMKAADELAKWIHFGIEAPESVDHDEEMERASDKAARDYDTRMKNLARSVRYFERDARIVDVQIERHGLELD